MKKKIAPIMCLTMVTLCRSPKNEPNFSDIMQSPSLCQIGPASVKPGVTLNIRPKNYNPPLGTTEGNFRIIGIGAPNNNFPTNFSWYKIEYSSQDAWIADNKNGEWINCTRGGAVVIPPPSKFNCNSITQSTGHYPGFPPFDTVKLDNSLISLEFTKGVFGSRLYRVRYGDKDLLYQNFENGNRATPKMAQTQWGQEGNKFVVFGGIESAFPRQEHGDISGRTWTDEPIACDPSLGAKVHTTTSPEDPYGNQIQIKTYLKPHEKSFYQHVHILLKNRGGSIPFMYYTNVMIPSNTQGAHKRDTIEVFFANLTNPNLGDFIVHSRDGLGSGPIDNTSDIFSDWKDKGDRHLTEAEWKYPNTSIPANNWLGYFYRKPVSAFGFKNLDAHYGMKVSALPRVDGQTMLLHPKFFCGHQSTISAAGTPHAYCEWWFSPNAETFWNYPTDPGTVEHLVRFDIFDI